MGQFGKAALVLAALWASACGGGNGSAHCTEGTLRCSCTASGSCNAGLAQECAPPPSACIKGAKADGGCISEVCVEHAGSGGAAGSGGIAGSGGGAHHSCVVTAEGGVRCWGYNDIGQLGDGSTSNFLPNPPTSNVITGVRAIAVGGYHTCALTTAGGVRCWGDNTSFKVSDTFRAVPVAALGFCQ